jgi:hypothetical protein
MIKLAIITGSMRPQRVNESVARWVYEIARQRQAADFMLSCISRTEIESRYKTVVWLLHRTTLPGILTESAK